MEKRGGYVDGDGVYIVVRRGVERGRCRHVGDTWRTESRGLWEGRANFGEFGKFGWAIVNGKFWKM